MKKIIMLSMLLLSTGIVSNGEKFNLIPTSLRVTVLDYLGNLVERATVIVFGNEEDYRLEKDPTAGPELTDVKGRVTFKKGITPKSYYIFVAKDDMNNNGAGVRTSRLDPNKRNKINIIIR